ncbi:GNAT family N-acetyltransferase [Candidatus Poribacteria bacterium]|nr:GNAT family N-acetyltransferase [Candidatus Poribacteria bacterium]
MINNIFLRIILYLKRYKLFRSLGKLVINRMVYYHIATPEDAEDILQHFPYKKGPEKNKTKEQLTQELKDSKDKEFFFMAKTNGRIIGKSAITLYPKRENPNHWAFSSFYVYQEYRGLGIGEKLLRLALKKAEESGATEIVLSVFDHLKPAIHLYRKVGFKHVSSHRRDDENHSLVHIYVYRPLE